MSQMDYCRLLLRQYHTGIHCADECAHVFRNAFKSSLSETSDYTLAVIEGKLVFHYLYCQYCIYYIWNM